MQNDTQKQILSYITQKQQASPKALTEHFSISRQALFKHLHKLQKAGAITKNGAAPRVFYQATASNLLHLAENKTAQNSIPPSQLTAINENFIIITPSGERKEGLDGFIYWCAKNKLSIAKTAADYEATLNKFATFKQDNLIDGTEKLKNSFPQVYLDRLFYLDFYSIERFGKTKLGQLLLYAKQSQDRKMIKDLISSIKPRIDFLIAKYQIDAVAFVPPTVKREVQFMKELERLLALPIIRIPIIKLKNQVAVPQKTLNKLEDRIENARQTMVVEQSHPVKNLLIIDDAVGSGSTINEIAAKFKANGQTTGKILGLAITGSFKGFDVISEV